MNKIPFTGPKINDYENTQILHTLAPLKENEETEEEPIFFPPPNYSIIFFDQF